MFHTFKYRQGYLHCSYPHRGLPTFSAHHGYTIREFSSPHAAKCWLSIKSRQPGPLPAYH